MASASATRPWRAGWWRWRALEVRLLDRTPDGPRLTTEGVALASLAEPMESAADAMMR